MDDLSLVVTQFSTDPPYNPRARANSFASVRENLQLFLNSFVRNQSFFLDDRFVRVLDTRVKSAREDALYALRQGSVSARIGPPRWSRSPAELRFSCFQVRPS